MRGLYVPADSAILERLRELARQERRRPQDQAALILERALGPLEAPTSSTEDCDVPSVGGADAS